MLPVNYEDFELPAFRSMVDRLTGPCWYYRLNLVDWVMELNAMPDQVGWFVPGTIVRTKFLSIKNEKRQVFGLVLAKAALQNLSLRNDDDIEEKTLILWSPRTRLF
jgi:hypothetical protein